MCCGWFGKIFINSFMFIFFIDLNEFLYFLIEMFMLVFLLRDFKVDGEDFRKVFLLIFLYFINNFNFFFLSFFNLFLNMIINII